MVEVVAPPWQRSSREALAHTPDPSVYGYCTQRSSGASRPPISLPRNSHPQAGGFLAPANLSSACSSTRAHAPPTPPTTRPTRHLNTPRALPPRFAPAHCPRALPARMPHALRQGHQQPTTTHHLPRNATTATPMSLTTSHAPQGKNVIRASRAGIFRQLLLAKP